VGLATSGEGGGELLQGAGGGFVFLAAPPQPTQPAAARIGAGRKQQLLLSKQEGVLAGRGRGRLFAPARTRFVPPDADPLKTSSFWATIPKRKRKKDADVSRSVGIWLRTPFFGSSKRGHLTNRRYLRATCKMSSADVEMTTLGHGVLTPLVDLEQGSGVPPAPSGSGACSLFCKGCKCSTILLLMIVPLTGLFIPLMPEFGMQNVYFWKSGLPIYLRCLLLAAFMAALFMVCTYPIALTFFLFNKKALAVLTAKRERWRNLRVNLGLWFVLCVFSIAALADVPLLGKGLNRPAITWATVGIFNNIDKFYERRQCTSRFGKDAGILTQLWLAALVITVSLIWVLCIAVHAAKLPVACPHDCRVSAAGSYRQPGSCCFLYCPASENTICVIQTNNWWDYANEWTCGEPRDMPISDSVFCYNRTLPQISCLGSCVPSWTSSGESFPTCIDLPSPEVPWVRNCLIVIAAESVIRALLLQRYIRYLEDTRKKAMTQAHGARVIVVEGEAVGLQRGGITACSAGVYELVGGPQA
jgi:hypothetical protein